MHSGGLAQVLRAKKTFTSKSMNLGCWDRVYWIFRERTSEKTSILAQKVLIPPSGLQTPHLQKKSSTADNYTWTTLNLDRLACGKKVIKPWKAWLEREGWKLNIISMSTSRPQQAVFEGGNPRKENNRKWRYLTQYPRTHLATATQRIEGCDNPNITSV